jgi:hypothetical protein
MASGKERGHLGTAHLGWPLLYVRDGLPRAGGRALVTSNFSLVPLALTSRSHPMAMCGRPGCLVGWLWGNGPAHTKDPLDRRSLVYDSVDANKGTKSFTALQLVYFTISYEEVGHCKFRWKWDKLHSYQLCNLLILLTAKKSCETFGTFVRSNPMTCAASDSSPDPHTFSILKSPRHPARGFCNP